MRQSFKAIVLSSSLIFATGAQAAITNAIEVLAERLGPKVAQALEKAAGAEAREAAQGLEAIAKALNNSRATLSVDDLVAKLGTEEAAAVRAAMNKLDTNAASLSKGELNSIARAFMGKVGDTHPALLCRNCATSTVELAPGVVPKSTFSTAYFNALNVIKPGTVVDASIFSGELAIKQAAPETAALKKLFASAIEKAAGPEDKARIVASYKALMERSSGPREKYLKTVRDAAVKGKLSADGAGQMAVANFTQAELDALEKFLLKENPVQELEAAVGALGEPDKSNASKLLKILQDCMFAKKA